MKFFNIHIQINLQINRGNRTPSRETLQKEEQSTISFSTFATNEINHAVIQHCYSTAKNYKTALRSFQHYAQGNVLLSSITDTFINDYGKWLGERGICLNTISCYMRSLRSIYNKAVKLDLARDAHPFRNAFTGKENTRKRAIEKRDIMLLRDCPLPEGSNLSLVRDTFLFSFYACGMPFIDIAFIKKSQLLHGYLNYRRHKTKQKISIRIEPCMQTIIDRYESPNCDYVFPYLTSYNVQEAYRQYCNKLCLYNKSLQRLEKRIGITGHLTSYVPRHTWASIAFASDVKVPIISKALGHTSSHTTQTYIQGINNTELDEANERLLEEIIR